MENVRMADFRAESASHHFANGVESDPLNSLSEVDGLCNSMHDDSANSIPIAQAVLY